MTLLLAILLSLGFSAPAVAQQCDDLDSCTQNDMCVGDQCQGTPRTGGSCDDGNACTINDTCAGGTCTGTAAPAGTSCNGACGTCQEVAPGFPLFCLPDAEGDGTPCNDNFACTINDVCQFGICLGTFRQCPDTDGNPCTGDFCNPETGLCQATNFPPCLPCQTCRRTEGSFACDPAPDGTACDDFEMCTPDSSCSDGECRGIFGGPTPTTGVPTATVTQGVPTPSPTGGAVACVGDCDLNGQVTVDEIVTAVNIALGTRNVADCLAADSNLDGQVTVDEIVTAVNNALTGC